MFYYSTKIFLPIRLNNRNIIFYFTLTYFFFYFVWWPGKTIYIILFLHEQLLISLCIKIDWKNIQSKRALKNPKSFNSQSVYFWEILLCHFFLKALFCRWRAYCLVYALDFLLLVYAWKRVQGTLSLCLTTNWGCLPPGFIVLTFP